jgi:hypothetical protein
MKRLSRRRLESSLITDPFYYYDDMKAPVCTVTPGRGREIHRERRQKAQSMSAHALAPPPLTQVDPHQPRRLVWP